MSNRSVIGKALGSVACSVVLLASLTAPVYAIDPHENPDEAEETFSDVALLELYRDFIGHMLALHPDDIGEHLGILAFASVPEDLMPLAVGFWEAGGRLTQFFRESESRIDSMLDLAANFQIEEGLLEMYVVLSELLPGARESLDAMRQATEETGEILGVPASAALSDLRRAYDEIERELDRAQEMIVAYQEELIFLVAPFVGISVECLQEFSDPALLGMLRRSEVDAELLPECLGIDPERLAELLVQLPGLLELTLELDRMELTMELNRTEAFVGELIDFEGTLAAGDEVLDDRQVDIQVDGVAVVTAITDTGGRYQGTFGVPYVYKPEMTVRAGYYPQEEDVGRHLPVSSTPMAISVLYYETELGFEAPAGGYPGYWLEIPGTLSYETSQAPPERIVAAYLDSVPVAEAAATAQFLLRIELPDDLPVGQHTLVLEVPPSGRYAPAEAAIEFSVALAPMTLDLSTPGVALIPGVMEMSGSVSSELGPVAGATVTFALRRQTATVTTDERGEFEVAFDVGLMPLIVGSLNMKVSVVPVNPWHAPLSVSRPLFLINLPGCIAVVVALAAFVLLMPRILRMRRRRAAARSGEPAVVAVQPAQTFADVATDGAWHDTTHLNPAGRGVIERYRLIARLVMAIGPVLMKPQQTLRELARECGGFLGPAARYFTELTGLVERVLYSARRTTKADVTTSQRLSERIEGVVKREDV